MHTNDKTDSSDTGKQSVPREPWTHWEILMNSTESTESRFSYTQDKQLQIYLWSAVLEINKSR